MATSAMRPWWMPRIDAQPSPTTGSRFELAFAVVASLACHLLWQWHGIVDPVFQNKDVAGIVYNARLFLEGDLPYVQSLEVKLPGAFLVFVPALAIDGLRGVWILSVFWGAATSLMTGLLARACFGPRYALPAVLLHAGGAGFAGFGDINYSFWLTLPYVGAAAFSCLAFTEQHSKRHSVYWAAAGAFACLAALTKPAAVPILGLFTVFGAVDVVRRRWRRVVTMTVSGVVGALAVVALALIPFAGNAWNVIELMRDSRTFGSEYIGQVIEGSGGLLPAWAIGAQCIFKHLQYASVFAALACVPAGRFAAALGARSVAWAPWVFLVVTLLGVGVTLRFYRHDNVQVLPALVLLAVRPGGIFGAVLEWLRERLWVGAVIPLLIGAYNAGSAHAGVRMLQTHLQRTDRAVLDMCQRWGARVPETDSVLAWGWHGWGVYEHCGRRAPGRIYKPLGTVTTANTNTCNQGFGRVHVRPGAAADLFARDLKQNTPGLIMWSTYYRGMGGDPFAEWPEVDSFLQERFLPVERWGPFVALLRRDLADPIAPTPPPWLPQDPAP